MKVVCFGEVLWDIFDGRHLPGGAPLNVAYHLNKLGMDSTVISKVGRDELGERLIQVIKNWGLDTNNCQLDRTYATSEVHPIIGSDHEVRYNIKFPVAWDYIEYLDGLKELAAGAQAFVFGSLVARNDISRNTLLKLLKTSAYNVFDVNLREQNYNRETILELLAHTQLLKVNHNELNIILGWLHAECTTEAGQVKFLQDILKIDEILITKGARGAAYYAAGTEFRSPVYPVKLKDTVGSGDAFLAAFLAGKLQGASVKQSLTQAAALGAFVASSTGACPDYSIQELEDFMNMVQIDIQ